MSLSSLHKNTLALIFASVIVIGFFISGITDVLDYFIVKVILFSGFGLLVAIAIGSGLKNSKKNRPEEILQDDSH